jgi:NADPH2:quinone reductase
MENSRMRAVVVREFGDIENATLADMPKPAPKAGEVLLEVHAVSVNFVDLVMMSGTYQFKPPLPFIPGKLPVGVVAAVGDGVTKFKPGDHALLMAESGGYAEFTVMPESQCVKLPPALDFTEAASMALVYDTAYFALKDRGRIQPGETVLILGATGGVGLAAIQLAKAMGARVFAAVASKDKEDIVRAAGADAIVDLSVPDLRESLRQQVFALTDKKGVDIIVDMLGGDIFDAAVRALAWCGRLIVIGFASGRIPSLKMNYVLVKNIEISGMQVSDYRKKRPADMQAAFAEIYRLHDEGKLKPLPTKAYPIAQFAQALHDIKDRKVRGRIVLTLKG